MANGVKVTTKFIHPSLPPLSGLFGSHQGEFLTLCVRKRNLTKPHLTLGPGQLFCLFVFFTSVASATVMDGLAPDSASTTKSVSAGLRTSFKQIKHPTQGLEEGWVLCRRVKCDFTHKHKMTVRTCFLTQMHRETTRLIHSKAQLPNWGYLYTQPACHLSLRETQDWYNVQPSLDTRAKAMSSCERDYT